jgi:hypothetical protein
MTQVTKLSEEEMVLLDEELHRTVGARCGVCRRFHMAWQMDCISSVVPGYATAHARVCALCHKKFKHQWRKKYCSDECLRRVPNSKFGRNQEGFRKIGTSMVAESRSRKRVWQTETTPTFAREELEKAISK